VGQTEGGKWKGKDQYLFLLLKAKISIGVHVCCILMYVIVIDWLTRNYGSKRTESEGAAQGRGLFT